VSGSLKNHSFKDIKSSRSPDRELFSYFALFETENDPIVSGPQMFSEQTRQLGFFEVQNQGFPDGGLMPNELLCPKPQVHDPDFSLWSLNER